MQKKNKNETKEEGSKCSTVDKKIKLKVNVNKCLKNINLKKKKKLWGKRKEDNLIFLIIFLFFIKIILKFS